MDTNVPIDAEGFVVIPAFNEVEVIHGVVERVREHFTNVVIVDDGSVDGTGESLADLPVTVVTHAVNLGQGAALQTGITYALSQGAEWIVTFDADGQHRIEDAISMVRLLQTNACDVVLGSRFLASGGAVNIPRIRALFLRLAVAVLNIFSKQRLSDAHNGLRAFNRKAAKVVNITQNGMAHANELVTQLLTSPLDIREIPVTIQYTEYSLRKGQSLLNALNIFIDLQVGRFCK